MLAAGAVVLIVVVLVVVLTQRSSARTMKQYVVSLDATCFDVEQALPEGPVPTGPESGLYLDKAVRSLRAADRAQAGIPLPHADKTLALRFRRLFHQYATSVGQVREALRARADVGRSADRAHQAYTALVNMAEPLDSSYCPPNPELP